MLIEHVTSIITINVQNGVTLHGHKPRNIIFICQMPHRELSVLHQAKSHCCSSFFLMFKKIIQSEVVFFIHFLH